MTSPAASLTIDVDGEAGLPDGGANHAHRLTSRSERRYGLTRGLARILEPLERSGVRATFYIPGIVVLEHAGMVSDLVARGHELGHHGHRHLRTDALDAGAQARELERGLEAFDAVVGRRPTGYRSPGWELTPDTLALLPALGFTHDSSLMDDDRPYRLDVGGTSLLELPVHWTLDDAPHFAAGGSAAALSRAWISELRLAAREGRHVTFTAHPEIAGRPHRVEIIDALVAEGDALGIRWITHGAACAEALARDAGPR